MKRIAILGVIGAAAVVALGLFGTTTASATTPPKPLPRVVVYVESQDLCYESIVTAQNLPNKGPFQTLEPDPDEHCSSPGIKTELGPGDPGYVGGRWEMTMPDGSVARFMCPLLGPGHPPA